jgi:hypothetical protein
MTQIEKDMEKPGKFLVLRKSTSPVSPRVNHSDRAHHFIQNGRIGKLAGGEYGGDA